MDKIVKNLAEIVIQNEGALAQDTDGWNLVCVAAMGLNGFWEAEEED